MVKESTRAASSADTRRSTRRTVTGQAASANATAANPVKSRPVRQVRQKKPVQKSAITTSDRPRRNVTAARSTSASTQHKRKRKGTSEASPTSRSTRGTTVGRRHSKKVKFTPVEPSASQIASTSSTQQPSIATVQETQVVSSVVIQDTTVPQVTTTTTPVMQPSKKRGRGRPPTAGSTAEQSRKRGHYAVDEDHRLILKPKRRKGDTFTVPIPTRPQRVCQVYAIGSNEFGQCGREEGIENLKKVSHIQALDKFNIVDISAGSLHNAALTVDGKVVTWGCNDHGTLGRFTDNPSSAEAKEILETGNYIIGEEEKPTYAEGLNNINIVKVVCGGNATFAISDNGHLYATGTFKGKDGIIGFSCDSRIKQQPIFTRYTPFEHLIIVDVAVSVDHALALTKEGDVYAWGNNEAYRLGKKFSSRKSASASLEPINLGLKHINRLYVGAYHNFVVNDYGKVWVFGFNNMGQCGLISKQAVVPPENHLFFNKVGQIKEFAAGEHHTLALMQDGKVFSFGRSDYGQLGLGDSVLPSANEAKSRVVIPTGISNLTSIKFIGAGDHFSMAVDTANKIYAWGFGEYYVLGNKIEGDVTSPFQMPNLNGKGIVCISCGSSHALFLIVDLGGNSMDVDTN